jgi:hypothetical protein
MRRGRRRTMPLVISTFRAWCAPLSVARLFDPEGRGERRQPTQIAAGALAHSDR